MSAITPTGSGCRRSRLEGNLHDNARACVTPDRAGAIHLPGPADHVADAPTVAVELLRQASLPVVLHGHYEPLLVYAKMNAHFSRPGVFDDVHDRFPAD